MYRTPFNVAHLSLCLQRTKEKGTNSLNRVPKLHSLCKCYGSECTAGKEQQVLPVLGEFTAFPHPKVFWWLLLTCQINESLWASVESPRDRVPFKTSSLLWHQHKSWVNLTFSISNTQDSSSPSKIHLRSFSRDNPSHSLSKALMWLFVVLLMLMLLFHALKNLLERTIFAPRGGKFPGAQK